jgi:hypothetical protein
MKVLFVLRRCMALLAVPVLTLVLVSVAFAFSCSTNGSQITWQCHDRGGTESCCNNEDWSGCNGGCNSNGYNCACQSTETGIWHGTVATCE